MSCLFVCLFITDNFFISDSRYHWEEAAVRAGGGAGHHQDLLHLPWRQLGVQTGQDWPRLRQVRDTVDTSDKWTDILKPKIQNLSVFQEE